MVTHLKIQDLTSLNMISPTIKVLQNSLHQVNDLKDFVERNFRMHLLKRRLHLMINDNYSLNNIIKKVHLKSKIWVTRMKKTKMRIQI